MYLQTWLAIALIFFQGDTAAQVGPGASKGILEVCGNGIVRSDQGERGPYFQGGDAGLTEG